MVFVEVLVGILGSLAVIVLVASLVMAVVGFIGALSGVGIERCVRCGHPYLSSPDLPVHHCSDHHASSIARLLPDRQVWLHHH